MTKLNILLIFNFLKNALFLQKKCIFARTSQRILQYLQSAASVKLGFVILCLYYFGLQIRNDKDCFVPRNDEIKNCADYQLVAKQQAENPTNVIASEARQSPSGTCDIASCLAMT